MDHDECRCECLLLPAPRELNAGILQPPFFSKEYDPARNCGSFGSIVGHELAHGFDDTGRHYDASDTLHYWWRSNETAHEFTKRTVSRGAVWAL
ncbi:hypothetical protein PsorP6_001093 [Peronosclerospora sorghi]|uniref:Uncharacterized protein n=1 Tax=Peronosclerospora sorghi TaxID=230839 RepID=A0ACC0WZ89_9STRA|nr:hypothetical protein PsorP6_001093 [Peronosclerospora sorghi]